MTFFSFLAMAMPTALCIAHYNTMNDVLYSLKREDVRPLQLISASHASFLFTFNLEDVSKLRLSNLMINGHMESKKNTVYELSLHISSHITHYLFLFFKFFGVYFS